MKRKILVISLMLCLVSISSSASELEHQGTTEVDLFGGDNVEINIILNWTGSYTVSCALTTSIEPDDMGISVEYSKNNFSMLSDSSHSIVMYVNTSIALIPGTYDITTHIYTEGTKIIEDNNNDYSGGSTGWSADDYQPGYVPTVPDNIPPVDPPEDNFRSVVYYTISDTDEYSFSYWILVVIAFIIVLLYLLSRKLGKKPGEKEK